MAQDQTEDNSLPTKMGTSPKVGMLSTTNASDSNIETARPDPCDDAISENIIGEMSEFDLQKALAGKSKFQRLGWKRLTIVLIVQAVALGSLSIPSAFAAFGMVLGVLLTVGIGLIAIYTASLVGRVKVLFPDVKHYADAGGLMFGKVGYELFGAMLTIMLVLLTASHCLTGTIAISAITGSTACSLIFGAVSAVVLFLLAIPPSFAEVAILGYIDFASIVLAIGITIIATGVKYNSSSSSHTSDWSAWPKPGLGFSEAFIALCNILFAFSFTISQFSFMDEMHTPTDYMKSIWSLGILEIVIYTITGATIYSFVGPEVKSPALLSAGPLITKVAFGVALPVIFISGSINTIVAARYIHGRIYENSITRFINTKKGWITWLSLILAITIISFIVAESVPFFGNLVAITSSLMNSGFTLHFPAMMWFLLLRRGSFFTIKNLALSFINGLIIIIGLVVLVGGTYAAIDDIVNQYRNGTVKGAFTCAPLG